MVVQVGSGNRATVEEYFFKPMEEAPVQAVALICLETVLKTIDSIVHFLLTKELAITALDILVKAGLAKLGVANDEYSSSEVYVQAADFRLATHIDNDLFEDLNNEVPLDDEIHRLCDRCKASSVNDTPLEGPVQEPEGLWQGDISAWIVVAAKGRDEVNSNHANTDKSRVGGKKEAQDDDEDEDDVDDDEDDDNDDVESGDEGNDDGEEGEEDGNEEDDDDEEDEEEEEEDDEDEEEVAPSSAPGNIRVQNVQVEVDDDSDEGEEEEEGVEDEDDFEEGEDEDGEGDEEDEEDDEDEEDIPEPPKKKKKSA